jgi:hypothetical protein
MDDISKSSNKHFAKDTEEYCDRADTNNEHPIKKCHFLDGKYFIVIDKSIIDGLYSSADNIYFSQELTKDRVLLLRPIQFKDL